MNKREFLAQLREALSFELPAELVESNIGYYSSYIDGEVRKGRGQEEVLAELGDPKLIARSISDAIKSGADGIPGTADDLDFTGEAYEAPRYGRRREPDCDTFDGDGNASCDNDGQTGGASASGKQGGVRSAYYQSSGCLGCLGALLLAGLVLSLIGFVVGGVLAILSPILGPVCLILLIVWLVKSIDRGR